MCEAVVNVYRHVIETKMELSKDASYAWV